jgi:hypothetical protein
VNSSLSLEAVSLEKLTGTSHFGKNLFGAALEQVCLSNNQALSLETSLETFS